LLPARKLESTWGEGDAAVVADLDPHELLNNLHAAKASKRNQVDHPTLSSMETGMVRKGRMIKKKPWHQGEAQNRSRMQPYQSRFRQAPQKLTQKSTHWGQYITLSTL